MNTILIKVAEMRDAQKKLSKTKNSLYLNRVKILENEVDEYIKNKGITTQNTDCRQTRMF